MANCLLQFPVMTITGHSRKVFLNPDRHNFCNNAKQNPYTSIFYFIHGIDRYLFSYLSRLQHRVEIYMAAIEKDRADL